MDLKHEITKYTLGLQAFQTVIKMVVKSYRQFSINGPIHSRVSGVKEPSKLELLNCPKRVGDVIRPKAEISAIMFTHWTCLSLEILQVKRF